MSLDFETIYASNKFANPRLQPPEKQHFLEIPSSKERIDASLHYLNSEIIDLSKKLNAKMNMQYGRN